MTAFFPKTLITEGWRKTRAKSSNHDEHDGHDEKQRTTLVIPANAGIQKRIFRREAPQTKPPS
jgi:hypothetical protein